MARLSLIGVMALPWLLAACATRDPSAAPTAMSQVKVSRGDDGTTLVALPDCPNWRRSSTEDFSNRLASNFGCADAVNLARQVADPLDLLRGRGTGAQEGQAAAAAVDRYRRGATMPLATSTASGATIAPGGPAPAATGGGGPPR